MHYIPMVWWLAPISAVCALVSAWILFHQVKRKDPGNARMQEIAGYVREPRICLFKTAIQGSRVVFCDSIYCF